MTELNLASPTLARLYLQQGHTAKAREMLDRLVREKPGHGGALALRDRLGICEGARLSARIVTTPSRSSKVQFKWRVFDLGHSGSPIEIWLRTWTGQPTGAQSASFARIACVSGTGQASAPLPIGPGSLSACIVAYSGDCRPGSADKAGETTDDLAAAAAIQPERVLSDLDTLDIEDSPEQSAQILAVATSLSWA